METQVKLPENLLNDWARSVLTHSRSPSRNKKQLTPKDLKTQISLLMQRESKNVIALWESYTLERKYIKRYLSDPKAGAVAYGLGFHLANSARLWALLARAYNREPVQTFLKSLHATEELSIIDLGCGSGAMSHTLITFLQHYRIVPQKISAELVDTRQAFVDFAETLVSRKHNPTNALIVTKRKQDLLDWCRKTLERLPKKAEQKRPTVLLAGYVMNEVMRDKRMLTALTRVLQGFRDAGIPILFIVADSANENISKMLMAFRDQLVSDGLAVAYPCPHQLGCPMLKSTKDWCYSEFLWQQPSIQKKMDKLLEVNRANMASSAYVFYANIASPLTIQVPQSIVVGRPLHNKTDEEIIVGCTPAATLHRKKAVANMAPELALRGMPAP